MKEMKISVVVPQRGCWEQTVECCSSLLRWHAGGVEVLVVDDGSDRDVRRQTRRWLGKRVRWLEQPAQGVTAAWNRGLEAATEEGLVLLNNDVVTRGPWLGLLTEMLQRNQRGLIGAEYAREASLRWLKTAGRLPGGARLLAGWCLGFRRDTWLRVGPFDESLRLYWSDTDWQLRWRQHVAVDLPGGGLCCLPRGLLLHRGHVSTRTLPDRRALWLQDRDTFARKWGLDG